jgi:membrane-associated phospholipid phosphatase
VSHKSLRIQGLALLGLLAAQSAVAQQLDDAPVISGGQIASFAGAGLAFGTSVILDRRTGPPSCAPCDPAAVPAFDRWIIRPVASDYSLTSDVMLIGVAAGTLGHTLTRDAGSRRAVASLEALAWTVGITALSKSLIGRKRPVLYTSAAPAVADDVKNQRSMPSGHAAAAFALASAYWLNNDDIGTPAVAVALTGALAVSVLRVAAAKHFPSDVLVGALVGTLTALAVNHARF